jgi:hypothetical protein
MHRRVRWAVLAVAMWVGMGTVVNANEGMWLFNNPPKAQLKKHFNFEPTEQWLEQVQKSSVRFNSGGSGSFVSADGLVMTNHHVGADAIQKLSDEKNNYLRDGFFAKNQADEKKCVDLELNVLMSIEDVTAQVEKAVAGKTGDDAAKARRQELARIEKDASAKTGLRSDVVTLYAGAQYHLYSYKKYTDVRLVFAPEQQAAFYGGDPDNFEYPRYDLDMTFFRVYENDKPVKVQHYFKWSKAGTKEGDLIFVSGHPGRTNRQNTIAELEYLRDTGYPFLLQRLHRMEVMLSVFSGRSEENARRAKDDLFGIQNSRKAREGGLAGLLDPKLFDRKRQDEARIRKAAGAKPEFKDLEQAYAKIAAAEQVRAKLIKDITLLENGAAFNCTLFTIGRTLLRAAEELPKPNGERLREFRDSNLESLKQSLFSEEPIYDDLEQAKFADSLTLLANLQGIDSELVKTILAGKSPRARAADLILGSKLKAIDVRKQLFDGGKAAVDASTDPVLALAKLVDAQARKLRKQFETEVDEVKLQAHAVIAKAKYAIDGTSTYPDATFTLRLAFGTVKGYEEDGKKIPPYTDYAGLYERSKQHNDKPPFDLPKRFVERKSKLKLDTPYNFVCTADIIGGNSGSPVLNQNAEVVGLIFDGNIQSLVLDFIFDEDQARALAVDSRGIIEALRAVYDANALADELTTGHAK